MRFSGLDEAKTSLIYPGLCFYLSFDFVSFRLFPFHFVYFFHSLISEFHVCSLLVSPVEHLIIQHTCMWLQKQRSNQLLGVFVRGWSISMHDPYIIHSISFMVPRLRMIFPVQPQGK